jgi:uncharacterized protein YcaQ
LPEETDNSPTSPRRANLEEHEALLGSILGKILESLLIVASVDNVKRRGGGGGWWSWRILEIMYTSGSITL